MRDRAGNRRETSGTGARGARGGRSCWAAITGHERGSNAVFIHFGCFLRTRSAVRGSSAARDQRVLWMERVVLRQDGTAAAVCAVLVYFTGVGQLAGTNQAPRRVSLVPLLCAAVLPVSLSLHSALRRGSEGQQNLSQML